MYAYFLSGGGGGGAGCPPAGLLGRGYGLTKGMTMSLSFQFTACSSIQCQCSGCYVCFAGLLGGTNEEITIHGFVRHGGRSYRPTGVIIYTCIHIYIYIERERYIYTYIYIYIYIYTHTHVYIYIYIHTYIHKYVYIYIYMYTHVNMHIHVYTITCRCMHMFIYIYI